MVDLLSGKGPPQKMMTRMAVRQGPGHSWVCVTKAKGFVRRA